MHVTHVPATPQKRKPSGGPEQKKPSMLRSLFIMLAVLAVVIIVFPKEPLTHAIASAQSPDGQVPVGSPSADYKGLVISEVMSANSSAVPDEKGEYNDWVEVWNSTDHPIDMTGVGLSDRSDRVLFLFPDATLAAGGRLVVFASDTNNADPAGTLHAKFKLSSAGETVYLFDPNAYVIHQVTIPILNSDVSYALAADGSYAQTQQYTPGFENTEEGFTSFRSSNAVTDGAIRINEIMADARTGLYDEDGELSDWIELYNTTGKSISLKDFALSDKENDPVQWRFPQDAVIPANGYYMVFCSGKDKLLSADKISHTNFRLSAERETVILSDLSGRLIDKASIDNLPMDSSLGRDDGGNWKVLQTATPGMPNNGAGAAQAEKNMRAANTSGIYISEVMSSSDDGNDWVELYNASTQAASLEGYGVSDNLGRPRKWQFPSGASIGPGEYMVVNLDGTNSQANGYHSNFKLLRAGGEVMSFSNPNGRVLDKMNLPLVPTDTSYGRNSSLEGFFYFDAPTMGSANGTGFLGFAQTPSFSVAGGLYYEPVSVSLNVPEGTTVHYTLDGSIPTLKNPVYDGSPITVNITTPIRARAFQNNLQPSEVITQTYFVNVYNNLPIISLVADPSELWNETSGMLAAGGTLDKSVFPYKLTNGNNPVYRTQGKEPRPGYVEYYLLDGTQVLSQGMEFGLQGQYSLDMPQKSFKVRAKSEQGDPYFEASLFESRPFTEYKSFVLRNSGNDNVWTRVNDAYQSMLIDKLDTTVIHQAVNPVVVYLNGQYWGHYNMRERVDRFFVAQHEGLPLDQADNMDILEASGTVDYGSNKEYKDLIAKVKTLSPGTNPEDLKYITDRVDVDNYFDYMALEWFFGNSDAGNTRYYKLKGDGNKWRWIFYDSDYGMFNSAYNSPASYMDPNGAGDQNINNTLIRKLLENSEMKEEFLKRMGTVFQTFTTQNMLDTFNGLVQKIEPEMPLHFARWAEFNEKSINADSPLTAEGALRYWKNRLDRSRNVIKKRPTLFYGMVQDYFDLSGADMVKYFGEKPAMPADALN
jgi:hypothetical protein